MEQSQQSIFTDLFRIWPEPSTLRGILLFGSRARGYGKPESDWDIGIIHTSEQPDLWIPDDWDLFFWTVERWEAGFALQLELSRSFRILYDPAHIIEKRLEFMKTHLLPRWEGHLKRL